jgi:hypothetical protein
MRGRPVEVPGEQQAKTGKTPLSEHSIQVSSARETLFAQMEEINLLRGEIKACRDELAAKEKELSERSRQLEQLSGETAALTQNKTALEDRIKGVEVAMAAMAKTLEMSNTNDLTVKTMQETIAGTLKRYKEQVTVLNDQLVEKQQTIAAKEVTITTLRQQKNNAETKLYKLDGKYKKLLEEYEQLQIKNRELLAQKQQLQEQLTVVGKLLGAAMNDLIITAPVGASIAENGEKVFARFADEIEAPRAENQGDKREITRLRKELETRFAEFKEQAKNGIQRFRIAAEDRKQIADILERIDRASLIEEVKGAYGAANELRSRFQHLLEETGAQVIESPLPARIKEAMLERIENADSFAALEKISDEVGKCICIVAQIREALKDGNLPEGIRGAAVQALDNADSMAGLEEIHRGLENIIIAVDKSKQALNEVAEIAIAEIERRKNSAKPLAIPGEETEPPAPAAIQSSTAAKPPAASSQKFSGATGKAAVTQPPTPAPATAVPAQPQGSPKPLSETQCIKYLLRNSEFVRGLSCGLVTPQTKDRSFYNTLSELVRDRSKFTKPLGLQASHKLSKVVKWAKTVVGNEATKVAPDNAKLAILECARFLPVLVKNEKKTDETRMCKFADSTFILLLLKAIHALPSSLKTSVRMREKPQVTTILDEMTNADDLSEGEFVYSAIHKLAKEVLPTSPEGKKIGEIKTEILRILYAQNDILSQATREYINEFTANMAAIEQSVHWAKENSFANIDDIAPRNKASFGKMENDAVGEMNRITVGGVEKIKSELRAVKSLSDIMDDFGFEMYKKVINCTIEAGEKLKGDSRLKGRAGDVLTKSRETFAGQCKNANTKIREEINKLITGTLRLLGFSKVDRDKALAAMEYYGNKIIEQLPNWLSIKTKVRKKLNFGLSYSYTDISKEKSVIPLDKTGSLQITKVPADYKADAQPPAPQPPPAATPAKPPKKAAATSAAATTPTTDDTLAPVMEKIEAIMGNYTGWFLTGSFLAPTPPLSPAATPLVPPPTPATSSGEAMVKRTGKGKKGG